MTHNNNTQHSTMQYNTSQHNTTQYNTSQYNTKQYIALFEQHTTEQRNTTQHDTPQRTLNSFIVPYVTHFVYSLTLLNLLLTRPSLSLYLLVLVYPSLSDAPPLLPQGPGFLSRLSSSKLSSGFSTPGTNNHDNTLPDISCSLTHPIT